MLTKAKVIPKLTGAELGEMWDVLPHGQFTKMAKKGEWPRKYKLKAVLRKFVEVHAEEQEILAITLDQAYAWEGVLRSRITQQFDLNRYDWGSQSITAQDRRGTRITRKYNGPAGKFELEFTAEML